MRKFPVIKQAQKFLKIFCVLVYNSCNVMFSWFYSGDTGYTRLDNYSQRFSLFCESNSNFVYIWNLVIQHIFWGLLPSVLLYDTCKHTLSLLLVIIVVLLCLYRAQDLLLYQPNCPLDARFNGGGLPDQHVSNQGSKKLLDNFEINWIPSTHAILDSVLLLLPSELRKTRPTVLYFHGNAGSIGHRIHGGDIFHLYKNCLVNIFIFDYRGYGLSTGTPNEWGLKQDSEAALNFLRRHTEINPNKIILFGRSLGGALAINLARKKAHNDDISAVIVENTFTSIRDIVGTLISKEISQYAPKFAIKPKYDSLRDIEYVQQPILFLSGLSDQLIPPKNMEDLYEKCNSPQNYIKKFNLGSHNNTWMCKNYYSEINKFINKY